MKHVFKFTIALHVFHETERKYHSYEESTPFENPLRFCIVMKFSLQETISFDRINRCHS
jgi:hypothetical protein